MSNVLKAIVNICHRSDYVLTQHHVAKNRANNMGDSLEYFVKNCFANSFFCDEAETILAHSNTFSYLGNQNNPPDCILKYGDAIEVKKTESAQAELELNSSYPIAKLYRDSTLLNKRCKLCDGGDWVAKDLVYIVGVVNDNAIKQMFFVYGEDFAAENEIYERIKKQIKSGILEIPDVEFSDKTKELGRVNRIDPLGITNLRIRGMWQIQSPFKLFRYVYNVDKSKDFNFAAIINMKKYLSFSKEDRDAVEELPDITMQDVLIKDPNNPAELKSAKLIAFAR